MNNNPLMNFARKVELSVKLPTNCNWYNDDMINYTPNGEVEVLPMLPKDELMLLNPDSLLSGQSNINLIESCVPSIKDSKKLLFPDANVLFLSIRKATYGDKLELNVECPKCQEKIVELGTSEKVKEAEKNGEICVGEQESVFSISELLGKITYLESEYVEELENGLKIYLTPTPLFVKEKYSNMMFQQQKLVQYLKNYVYDIEDDDKKIKNQSEISECYIKMNVIANRIITESIDKIMLPDGTTVIDKEMIYEFISNTPSNIVLKINEKIGNINSIGLTSKIEHTCRCCGHKWETQLIGFNHSDFFGIGS